MTKVIRTTDDDEGTSRVTFERRVLARRAISLSSYTDTEITDCWFSDEDLEQFSADVLRTAELVSNNEIPLSSNKQDSFCERGTEHRTRTGSRNRIRNKICALKAVLLEQKRQWENEIHDEAAIASAYRQISGCCTTEARLKALKDREAVLLGDFDNSSRAAKPCSSSYSDCRKRIKSCPTTSRHVTFNAAA
jgi:hypothetical protein